MKTSDLEVIRQRIANMRAIPRNQDSKVLRDFERCYEEVVVMRHLLAVVLTQEPLSEEAKMQIRQQLGEV